MTIKALPQGEPFEEGKEPLTLIVDRVNGKPVQAYHYTISTGAWRATDDWYEANYGENALEKNYWDDDE